MTADASATRPANAGPSALDTLRWFFGSFAMVRLRDGILVIFLVVTVVFLLGHVFGNPAAAMLPHDATDEQIDRLKRQLGLDRPLHVQFVEYFAGLLRGDFGQSIWQDRPALTIVLEALPATLLLTFSGLVLAAIFGSVLGVLSGAWPGSPLDRVANFISVCCLSVPHFWLGLLLIVVVAVQLRLLPTSGFYSWQGLILPALTVGILHGARVLQLVRSATFEEMTKPYALVARSKGLHEQVVLWKHVWRNIGVTVATIVGWEYVRMLGGSVFSLEVVFAWPGVGQLMINAVARQDFNVLQAAVIVTGFFVILVNFVVDMVYGIVDSRIRAT